MPAPIADGRDAATRASARVFSPFRLGPIELRNRFVKCGTNEGMSRAGLVTEPLVDWHRAFAAGGVAMTTLAYCSVSADGRTLAAVSSECSTRRAGSRARRGSR